MNNIGERLDYYMKLRGLNANKLAVRTKIHATTIKNYITNSTSPDNLKLDKVAEALEINSEWLKTGQGSPELPLENKKVVSHELVKPTDPFENNNGNRFLELPNGKYYMLMPLAEFNIQAGLLDNYQDAQFLMDLDQHGIFVEKPVNGRYVAFRVNGDSMYNGTDESIPRNSIVSTRELQRHLWVHKLHLRDFPYWVIYTTKSKMPLLKEITYHDVEKGVIMCHSLNDSPEFTDFELKLDDVQALFYVIDKTLPVSKKLSY